MDNKAALSRRSILQAALAISAAGSLATWPRPLRAQPQPLTPSCDDGHASVTLASTAGPYFKSDSPQRADFIDARSQGHPVRLAGRVLSRHCEPVARALLDLWHADQDGVYDLDGFRYRGHVFTDEQGRFEFRTIEPAVYPGRTRHFHFKVQAPHQPVLTTQLFFPGEPRNATDPIFRPQLLMQVSDSPAAMRARFDFVVAT